MAAAASKHIIRLAGVLLPLLAVVGVLNACTDAPPRRAVSPATTSTAAALSTPLPTQTPTPVPTPTPLPTPTPTPTPINPDAVLSESGEVMAALDSFRFRLEHAEGGGTPLVANLLLTEVSGSVQRPDRLMLEYTGVSGNFVLAGGVASIGGDVYMTHPLSGEWQPVPAEISPLGFFDPSRGIASIMAQVQNATLLSYDGATYLIIGELPAAALSSLMGNVVADATVDVELQIAARTLYLTQVRIDGRVTLTEHEGIERLISLSDFNEPIDIIAPQ